MRDNCRNGYALRAKTQTPDDGYGLDGEGNNPPIAPAIRSTNGKMKPSLRHFDGLENAAQSNDRQERASRSPLLPQQYDRQILPGHRQYRSRRHDKECERRKRRLILLPKRIRIGLQLAEGGASDSVHLRKRREDGIVIERYCVLVIAYLRRPVEQSKSNPVHCLRDRVCDGEAHHM